MAIMANTDNRFVNLEKKIGVFVLVAILGVAILLGFVAIERDFFSPKVRLYTVADSGKDLIVGMPVKLSGFKIGKVSKLYLDDITKLKIELLINASYSKWIKTDSRIVFSKEGLIGEAVLEITPGSKGGLNINENDNLPFERAVELSEIAEEMRLEVKQLMGDLRSLIGDISDPQGDVKATFRNFNQLSREMLVTFKTIDESVGRFDSILDQTELAVNRIRKSAKGIDSDIPKILSQIDRSLANLEQITEDLNSMLKKVAPKIPATVGKGLQVMEEVEDVLDALKRLWPISRGMEEKKYEMQSVDSYE